MKHYSATERLCLPNGKSFMLIQDETSKVYDFPTLSLWCSHVIFAVPYWGIKHIRRWWCVLVSGLLLDVSSQKLAAAQALCPLMLLGAATHLLGLLLWKLVPKHFAPSFIASIDHGCIVDTFLCIGDEICFHKVYLVIISKAIGLCSFQICICLHWWEEYQASGELEGFWKCCPIN